MVNYSNGKIYKIEPECDYDEGDIYIGSTTKKYLSQRMDLHRCHYKRWKIGLQNKTTSYDIFDKYGLENCDIILLENVNASSNDELKAREAYYIKTLKCVNRCLPLRKIDEYIMDNKDKILSYYKEYYQINKEDKFKKLNEYYRNNSDKINEKRKNTKFSCPCGSVCIRVRDKPKHERSLKHIQYMESLNK